MKILPRLTLVLAAKDVFGRNRKHRHGTDGDSCCQVEEIVTMEDEEFASIAPIYGLIFLFKWTQVCAALHSVKVFGTSRKGFGEYNKQKNYEFRHTDVP